MESDFFMRALFYLGLVSGISFLLGAVFLPPPVGVDLYSQMVYYVLLLGVFLFAGCLLPRFHRPKSKRSFFLSADKGVFWRSRLFWFGFLFSMIFAARGSDLSYKTVLDEHIIAATARSLHEGRIAIAPTRAMKVDGVLTPLAEIVDKRPTFFPFLVSIGHDLFGYHPERSLHLNNFVLTPLLFVCLYVLGSRIAGPPGGALLMLLIATIPLFSTISASGGLELLNFLLLVLILLFADDFLREPSAENCGALCFSAVLLAHTRYESILFIFPVALIILITFIRDRTIRVYWPLYVSPILLIPCLWLNRIFELEPGFWQLEGKSNPFSLDYVADNFAQSIHYFFNLSSDIPNSWFLAFSGLLAFLILLICLKRSSEKGFSLSSVQIAGLVCIPGFLMLYGLLLAYSWDFGGRLTQRLYLPLYLPLALLSVACLPLLQRRKMFLFAAYFSFGAYVVAYGFPVTSVRSYEKENASSLHYDAAKLLLDEGAVEGDAVIIAGNSFFFYVYGYSSLATVFANEREAQIKWYLEQPIARPVYYFTAVTYDHAAGGSFTNLLKHDLDPAFETELVAERFVATLSKVQLFRITKVNVESEFEPVETNRAYMQQLGTNMP